MASYKREVSERISLQISEAQATYDKIKARYEEKLAIQESELHAAMQHTLMLQTRKKIVDNEMNEIYGVIHPIRRLPVEMLKQIFEATVENSPKKFSRALQLSHVCQHWRVVALDTPLLWNQIIINFLDPLESITEYWNWAAKRVKMTPVDVFFNQLGEGVEPGTVTSEYIQEQQNKVAVCSFPQIPFVRNLVLNTGSEFQYEEAFSLITQLSTGELGSLTLNGDDSNTLLDGISWIWDDIVPRLPSLKALTLEGLAFSFDATKPFSVPQDSPIRQFYTVDPLELLRLCPNLESLTTVACEDDYRPLTQNPTPVTISTLTFLNISHGSTFPWESPLLLPSLSTLIFHTEYGEAPNEFLGFLVNHPSIFDLKMFVDYLDLISIAKAAPQLTRLTLETYCKYLEPLLDWTSTSLQGPAFPQLEILDLCNAGYRTTEEVDRLIRIRCLPAIHDKSELPNGCRPLRELVIPLPSGFSSKSQFAKDAIDLEPDRYTGRLSWL
ncbi:hypothetical protein M408DRAFT_249065 [Serendipita vermifera MAFF 305830]|uniref:F-box domain-containing protein n=1 Tax=Serendipita vermifera MAFF 305830 TaxID=933852 RepID=A0A0C3AV81_SERVB|nr:hypothetical protein M408DRAFT_249065 [Serendipita vermifera MAFF 305830]